MLRSNSALREVKLVGGLLSDSKGGEPHPRVPLLHLKKLEFCGYSRKVFWLLYHLDYPATRVCLILDLLDCTVKDISETIGPYIRDYLRRRGGLVG